MTKFDPFEVGREKLQGQTRVATGLDSKIQGIFWVFVQLNLSFFMPVNFINVFKVNHLTAVQFKLRHSFKTGQEAAN